MAENKVQFNLKNVHYAALTVEDGVPSWATPVHVPGTVPAIPHLEPAERKAKEQLRKLIEEAIQ